MVTEQIINQQFAELIQDFPNLNNLIQYNNGWKIIGSIDIIDDEDNYWETYEVEIFIPTNYPLELPILTETSNKIDRTAEWHNSVGICCLSTNAVMFSTLSKKISILRWVNLFVRPYLSNHIYRIKTGSYANGEFDHGSTGILQGYYRIFNTNRNDEVIKLLNLICGNIKLGRNNNCFCNSGIKYKNCFLKHPYTHNYNIPINILQFDLKMIGESFS